jgi:predicted nucleic acid-binding protein
MTRVFVDANVFLRLFTRGPEDHRVRARELLRAAEAGEVELVTGPPVFFEAAWVLRSCYHRTRDEVLAVLEHIAGFPGLSLTDAPLVDRALDLARRHGTDFPDAYIAASRERADCHAVATFNRRHFERMDAPLHNF